MAKIREITAGHLYQGLGQSPQSFLMFGLFSHQKWWGFLITQNTGQEIHKNLVDAKHSQSLWLAG